VKITGKCLCGAVQFELEDDFTRLNFCHCEQCQRATGSAHASNFFTAPDNIKWTKGQEYVKRFDVPGRSISKAFCTRCGSGMPYVSGTGKALIVPAGALDRAPEDIRKIRNIFWTERADWYEEAVAAECRDTF
jgi:hypothetical protein